ncbi:hypothetical protein [Stackebrandtia nassauensis]|uniref:Uncharacterized protein n=1 Tax=Stackebrandtia nassauensis (strain DSM 44728 / CIP 108903 / NRRL B-16338 / NBRC 102104 / LLR-40K-21) TaxID=446470 RepID=D3PTZ7_STANL|nr:hypothetical protein [Stackebrandtia nassauensis]ADD39755.1 hypothetical protein Snas_0033 [Stackebrandtia nassauensis DSM 44728]
MGTSYEGLNLDQIHQIASADNDSAVEIDEQADGARVLAEAVACAVDRLAEAHRYIGQEDLEQVSKALMVDGDRAASSGSLAGLVSGAVTGFEGEAARAAIDRVVRLTEVSESGREQLEPQHKAFSAVADLVRRNHLRITELREEREKWLSVARADPENSRLREEFADAVGVWGLDQGRLIQAINDRYDADGRSAMQSSAEAYLRHVESLAPPRPYDGPRRSRGGSGGGSGDGGSATSSPGPTLASLPGAEAPLPAASASAPASSSGVGGPPLLQTGPVAGPVLPPVTGPTVPPSASTPGPFGPSGYYVPSVRVTPPVIGARSARPFGATGTPPLRPNPNGVVRPVIGQRPGPVASGTTRPVVRPVINGAANTVGRGTPAGAGGRGAPKPGSRPIVPSRHGRPPQPGTRVASDRPVKAEGKVIRAGTERLRVESPEFSRTPRNIHGGNENLNRAVIRGSRALTPSPAERIEPKPAPAADPDWCAEATVVRPVIRGFRDKRDEPVFDPGPIVTPHSLGRGTGSA